MILFAVLAVWAGFGLVTSGGNPTALTDAKSRFTNAFIGLLIVLSAWLLVDTLMRGLLGGEGEIRGYGPWSEIQCMTQSEARTDADEVEQLEQVEEDESAIPATNPFTITTNSVNSLGLLTCGPSDPRFPDCGFDVTLNNEMNPILDTAAANASQFNDPNASLNMQSLLNGPFARLQANFGRPITINDGIVKTGSSRESGRRGSQHFNGNALDLSTRGLSNDDKLRLFREAKNAGFTGFGFGENILHVDMGPQRAWAYNNSTYGGQPVSELITEAKR